MGYEFGFLKKNLVFDKDHICSWWPDNYIENYTGLVFKSDEFALLTND